jgi:flagellin-specific chaperone FliS
MGDSTSAGQRFIHQLNQTRDALSNAAQHHDDRAIHISQAVHLLRGDMMVCARTVLAPAVADRLAALCEYMCTRLAYAELHDVDAPFGEVIRLLDELRRAWPSLDRTRVAASAATKVNA